MKVKIKVWNVEVFGNLDYQINHLVASLNTSDALASSRSLTEAEASVRRKILSELWCVQKKKDSLMYTKSRLKWLEEGVSNSSFFHSCVNYRRRKNNIFALRSGDR